MALTAREVVFYLRVQNNTSSGLKKVARDIGGLRNLKNVHIAALKQQAALQRNLNSLEIMERKNLTAITEAEVKLDEMRRATARAQLAGSKINSTAMANQLKLIDAQAERLATLNKEQELYAERVRVTTAALAEQTAEADRLGKALPVERATALLKIVSRVGRGLIIGGSVGLIAAGAVAISAAKLSSGATLAATQARQPGQSFRAVPAIASRITDSTIKLMKQFPASAADMQDSFYQIFSGTNITNVGKATKELKVFDEMAVAGGSDLKTMTDAGISLYNNFPTEFKNMTDAANQFFAVVRYGRMNATQFASSLTRVLPIAKAAGLGFKDVGDAMAFITRQTGGARTGLDATGLARLIEMLGKPDAIAGLAKYGIAVKDASGKMRPLVDIISEMHDKLVATGKFKPGPDLLNLIKTLTASASKSGTGGSAGTVQGRRILDYLLTDTKAYLEVSGQVNRDNGEMIKSFEAMNRSPGIQWARFTNQLKVLAYTIGTKMIPAFITLSKPVTTIVNYFNKMSEGTQKVVADIIVFGSAGAVATGVLLKMVSGVGRLVGWIMILARAGGLKVALGLGAEGGMATPQLAVILAAVLALAIALPILITHLHQVSQAFGGLRGILLALSILIGGFTLVKVLTGLVALGGEANAAALLVGKLRLGLLGLVALGAIVVPIVMKVTTDAQKPHGHDLRTVHFDGGLKGILEKAAYASQYYTARGVGQSKSQSRDYARAITGIVGESGLDFLRDTTHVDLGIPQTAKYKAGGPAGGSTVLYQIPQYWQRRLGNLIADGQVSDQVLQVANNALLNKDYATFDKIYNYYLRPAAKRAGNMSDTSARQASITAQLASSAVTAKHVVLSQTFMQRLAGVAKLQGIADKTHTFADYKTFQAALVKLNSDYNSKLYQGYISEYLSRVESADSAHLAKTKKDNTAYLDQLNNMYSNIGTMYSNFLQQQEGIYGSIFQGPYMQSAAIQAQLSFNNNKPTPAMVLKDVHSQLFQGNRFNAAVAHLSKKGAPQSLVDQLMAAGPSAMNDIQALNRLTPSQLRDYINTWNRMQAAIKANTMKQLNNQLHIYRSFGKNVAQAIIAGISSEDPKLQDKLKSIIDGMFPDLVKKAGKAPVSVPKGSKTNIHPTTHVTHLHYSPTIHNPKSESVDTALKKSFFHMRTHKWF